MYLDHRYYIACAPRGKLYYAIQAITLQEKLWSLLGGVRCEGDVVLEIISVLLVLFSVPLFELFSVIACYSTGEQLL